MTTLRGDIIESTAGQVAAELARRGVLPHEKVTITIDADDAMLPGRRETRARVVAAELSDGDVDRLIKQAIHDVNEDMRREADSARDK